jgi:hypothetical protein
MLIGILFYMLYALTAGCTAVVAQTIFWAHLTTHPNVRDRGLEWTSWPLGILTGITWPLTIPMAIIIAGVVK